MAMQTPFSLRPHVASAGMAALFAVLLHTLVWLSFSAAWLVESYAAVVIAPICLMIIGLIVLTVVKSMAPERVTFFAALLLAHILLSSLSLVCGELLMEVLQRATGPHVPFDSPEGDLSFLYFLLVWLLLAVGMGILQFLFAVIFLVRDALRATMGYVPKKRKTDK